MAGRADGCLMQSKREGGGGGGFGGGGGGRRVMEEEEGRVSIVETSAELAELASSLRLFMVNTEPRCVNISVTLDMESLSASPGGGPVFDILSYIRNRGAHNHESKHRFFRTCWNFLNLRILYYREAFDFAEGVGFRE